MCKRRCVWGQSVNVYVDLVHWWRWGEVERPESDMNTLPSSCNHIMYQQIKQFQYTKYVMKAISSWLWTYTTCVKVPCRNRLSWRIFWSHCCVGNAVSLNFLLGWGFIDLLIFTHMVYKAHISPALIEVQGYTASNTAMWSAYVTEKSFDLYTGLVITHSIMATARSQIPFFTVSW